MGDPDRRTAAIAPRRWPCPIPGRLLSAHRGGALPCIGLILSHYISISFLASISSSTAASLMIGNCDPAGVPPMTPRPRSAAISSGALAEHARQDLVGRAVEERRGKVRADRGSGDAEAGSGMWLVADHRVRHRLEESARDRDADRSKSSPTLRTAPAATPFARSISITARLSRVLGSRRADASSVACVTVPLARAATPVTAASACICAGEAAVTATQLSSPGTAAPR